MAAFARSSSDRCSANGAVPKPKVPAIWSLQVVMACLYRAFPPPTNAGPGLPDRPGGSSLVFGARTGQAFEVLQHRRDQPLGPGIAARQGLAIEAQQVF